MLKTGRKSLSSMTEQKREIELLNKQVKKLKLENEILKKFNAYIKKITNKKSK
ncbi:hypothetical protein [Spiroplasma endosymbiont of Virgichneumon dumeticola]|uniref:hypothetical protein n=1 Tax=Spiroplasma endosymbiont of Virgichneumon dumeticola TaxID=3139323 RepID=UPI0035C8CCF3